MGIRLAAAEPGDQLAIFGEALRELHEKANYLYEEAGRYWFSTKPTLNRLAEDRAAAFPEHAVDTEIVRILSQEASQRASFSRVYAAPDEPTSIDEAAELALVILGPSRSHSKGMKDSPAIDAVTDTLMRCRTGQRRYRNTLVFAAPDEAQLLGLRQVVRRAMAWAEIESDRLLESQITTSQAKDVKEKAKTGRESAEKATRSTWTHMLFAEKDPSVLDGKPFDVSQTSLMSKDRSSITVSAYDKMSSRVDGIVKDTLGPTMLMAKLDSLWGQDKPHLRFGDVKEWFASYPYMPKLRDTSVLEAAIGQGVSNADPHFAYADGWDEGSGKYRGLVFRALTPQRLSDDGLIVRRAIAEAVVASNVNAVSKQSAIAQTGASVPINMQTAVEDGGIAPAEPAAARAPRRFYGSVELDIVRPVKSFDAILNAVVMELQRTQGAKVKLTLEIEAEASAGFPDSEVSVVRDNARQLKFKAESTGFED
jgi:hypothetical protein